MEEILSLRLEGEEKIEKVSGPPIDGGGWYEVVVDAR